MNFRNLVVSTIALAAVVGCSSSQGGDEKSGSTKDALTCRTCGDPTDPVDPPPPPAPKVLEGATCAGNSTCSSFGPFAFGSDQTKWTAFENSLNGLGCGQGNGYSVELTRPDGAGFDSNRYSLCQTSTALTTLISANPGSSQGVYCDTCLGTPSSGYTWVSWDYLISAPGSCPGGCTGKTSPSALY